MSASNPRPANSSRLLVTGASGNLGRMVLTHLLDSLHIEPRRILAGSRTPHRLSEFSARGVSTVWMDFQFPASVEAAARGVDRVLMISLPDDSSMRAPDQTAAVQALAFAGVRHLLYTSFLHADRAIAQFAVDHRATETAIQASGISGSTLLRQGVYFDNLSVWIAGTSCASGKWLSACEHGRFAGIAREDAALACATALAIDDFNHNKIYELSSTQALTMSEVVDNVSKAVGQRIQSVDVEENELVDALVDCTGVAEASARAFVSVDLNIAAGLAGPSSGRDFQKLVGRAPMSHAQWVETNRAELLLVA